MNQIMDQIFKVAIYLRLSKDDGDFSFAESGSAGKNESNSIHNQRELIMAYMANHPELVLFDEYKDDGYTGTNFDRPDFKRMMGDVRKGNVNCVIVKDLSRFGRDYIDCGNYIEKIFPQLGIRFISINDGFDTATASSSDSIVVPFKNLINDSYSRDISIKVRSNLDVKRRQGEFISNFAVYGYEKDPQDKNHLVVDEYAAEIIRDIFKWKLEGLSPERIASRLNDRGILSPMEYKKSKGSNFKTEFHKSGKAVWSHVAVRRILRNPVYIGVLAQGKRTTPNYKTRRYIVKDESQWVKVEGTHEAIISRDQFDTVQQLLREDTRASERKDAVHPYCGRIFCADCGAPMVRKSVTSAGKSYVYYVCSTNKSDKNSCSKHSIREDILNDAVLATIQQQIDIALDMDRALSQVESLAWEKTEIQKIDSSIEYQQQLIERNNALRLGIYEDLHEGVITKSEFITLKAEFSARIEASKQMIEHLITSKSSVQQGITHKQGWLAQFREYENIAEVSRLAIVALVEHILVSEKSEIEVVFRHRDQFADIMEFLAEQEQRAQGQNIITIPRLEVI